MESEHDEIRKKNECSYCGKKKQKMVKSGGDDTSVCVNRFCALFTNVKEVTTWTPA